MSIAGVLMLIAGGLGMGGIVTTAADFDPSQPLYGVGLLAIGVGCGCGLTGLLVSRRTRIFRAFDVGYRAGFHDGRQCPRPVVVDLHDRERRRQRQ